MNRNTDSHTGPQERIIKDKNRVKKRIIITAIILLILGIVSYVVIYILDRPAEPASPYLENIFSPDKFVMIEEDPIDIFEDEEYLQYDRSLYMSEGGMEIAVLDEGDCENDKGALFFLKYFAALENGETDNYNSMFTDNYYTKYLPHESFTQQMVYDIHCQLISKDESAESSNFAYIVSYKIHKNNGTFREDITSDASRAVLMTLTGTSGYLKIDNITYVN